ncbi:MAG: NAD(+)/NADH kinase [Thermoprotei archaeon]|nr:NAD(+)/NADH kinase [TACK group archaeon]
MNSQIAYPHWQAGVGRIYLSKRPNNLEAERAAQKIAEAAKAKSVEVIPLDPFIEDQFHVANDEKPSIMISLGGDGTLLRSRMKLGNDEIPMLGVNYGRLGALSELDASELDAYLDRIISGDFYVEERTLLETRGKTFLNEALVKCQEPGKSIKMALFLDGRRFFQTKADGLIVATPTGSSAYAFLVGGFLIEPTFKAMVVVPIAPLSWGIRPFVTEENEIVVSTGGNAVLVLDGKRELNLRKYEPLKIGFSKNRAKFIRFRPFSFSKLYHKLQSAPF